MSQTLHTIPTSKTPEEIIAKNKVKIRNYRKLTVFVSLFNIMFFVMHHREFSIRYFVMSFFTFSIYYWCLEFLKYVAEPIYEQKDGKYVVLYPGWDLTDGSTGDLFTDLIKIAVTAHTLVPMNDFFWFIIILVPIRLLWLKCEDCITSKHIARVHKLLLRDDMNVDPLKRKEQLLYRIQMLKAMENKYKRLEERPQFGRIYDDFNNTVRILKGIKLDVEAQDQRSNTQRDQVATDKEDVANLVTVNEKYRLPVVGESPKKVEPCAKTEPPAPPPVQDDSCIGEEADESPLSSQSLEECVRTYEQSRPHQTRRVNQAEVYALVKVPVSNQLPMLHSLERTSPQIQPSFPKKDLKHDSELHV